ncbi:hypothetical protein ACOACO_16525 [Nocardioides sp. CPCC 205120]|uniref:hypothetical protein n=1 Tax=Nocardioides sp. CPCC 205120 TaxID=3406462 RepID=UPI003B512221
MSSGPVSSGPASTGPVHLRPPRRPGLVRALEAAAVLGAVLVLVGAPVWWLMHSAAQGWTDARVVEATVAEDARCTTGPPPGSPRTCEATWTPAAGAGGQTDGPVEGKVSERYGGDLPAAGGTVEARVVSDGDEPLALTGFGPVLLRWALAAPYLTGAGVLLLALAVTGLVRTDPRWASPRTDLPQPGA